MANEDLLKKVIAHCKEYGFVFQSSEIYDGLAAVYDYGQNGVELRNNIKNYWWKAMVQMNENIVGLDSAIFMHPKVWKASGHVDLFNDPMIDNKTSKKRYRVDHLLEAKIENYQSKNKIQEAQALEQAMNTALEHEDLQGLYNLVVEHGITCEVSGTKDWTEVRQFNLMFSTEIGAVTEESNKVYLRPETAQGIFVNFLNVQKTGRMKLPFGIAQIGKAFRNEVVARQFIMRMREFEQMEMQFFVKPGTQKEWYEYWKSKRLQWHLAMGIPASKYRYHDHVKLAHYADNAVDIEFEFPFGFKEVEGIHSRTDFDLKQHEALSGKKLQFFDPVDNQNFTPYVVETSIGLDRCFLLLLCSAYAEETITNGDKTDSRTVLRLPAFLAPIKVAVFPLTKKDGLPEKAREIMDDLQLHFNCFYEEKDAIGKRYRRHDAIGTPFCITIDHETLENETVTLRYRDTMEQKRIAIKDVLQEIQHGIDITKILKTLR